MLRGQEASSDEVVEHVLKFLSLAVDSPEPCGHPLLRGRLLDLLNQQGESSTWFPSQERPLSV